MLARSRTRTCTWTRSLRYGKGVCVTAGPNTWVKFHFYCQVSGAILRTTMDTAVSLFANYLVFVQYLWILITFLNCSLVVSCVEVTFSWHVVWGSGSSCDCVGCIPRRTEWSRSFGSIPRFTKLPRWFQWSHYLVSVQSIFELSKIKYKFCVRCILVLVCKLTDCIYCCWFYLDYSYLEFLTLPKLWDNFLNKMWLFLSHMYKWI